MTFRYFSRRDRTDFTKVDGAPAWASEVQYFLVKKYDTYFSFEFDSWSPGAISAFSDLHGDVYTEKPSHVDFKHACEMEKALLEEYGNRFHTEVGTVDECVYLRIKENRQAKR